MSLLDEIRVACTADEIAARNDALIAAKVSVGRTRVGAVTWERFSIWVAATGIRAAIEDHANNPASPLRASALSLKDLLIGGRGVLDFGVSDNAGTLSAWVTHGGITEAQAAELLAMATQPAPISVADVSACLNAQAAQ